MDYVLAILSPGQGAQAEGFLTDWLEVPSFATAIEAASQASGLDLAQLGSTATDEQIKDTAIAQPLLVAASLASFSALAIEEKLTGDNVVFAGHSVGEIASAAFAGVFTDEQAMSFVTRRAQAMAAAAKSCDTSMVAILGGELDQILARLAELNLTPANFNAAGQLVAAGASLDLAKLFADPQLGKARVRQLKVAGAFHSPYMAPAREALAEYASQLSVSDAKYQLLANRDGAVVKEGADYLARLVAQVANPVRWDLCQQTLSELGVTGLIELTPAGTLAGIAKRSLPGVEIFKLTSPDQLGNASEFCHKHLVQEG